MLKKLNIISKYYFYLVLFLALGTEAKNKTKKTRYLQIKLGITKNNFT